jgi:hypothetical protein
MHNVKIYIVGNSYPNRAYKFKSYTHGAASIPSESHRQRGSPAVSHSGA